MNLRPAIAIAAVTGAALLLSGCGGGEAGHATASTTTTSSTPVAVAPAKYTTADDETKPGQHHMTMTVTTDDTAAIEAAWRRLKAQLLGQGDGAYWVAVDCGLPNPNGSDRGVRLGNGKIAVGNLAAARTGLQPNASELKFNPGTLCRDSAPTTAAALDGPLDEAGALQACKREMESQYVADQLPITVDGGAQKVQSWFVVTGTAQGREHDGRDTALMDFTCTVEKTAIGGRVVTKLTEFTPR